MAVTDYAKFKPNKEPCSVAGVITANYRLLFSIIFIDHLVNLHSSNYNLIEELNCKYQKLKFNLASSWFPFYLLLCRIVLGNH